MILSSYRKELFGCLSQAPWGTRNRLTHLVRTEFLNHTSDSKLSSLPYCSVCGPSESKLKAQSGVFWQSLDSSFCPLSPASLSSQASKYVNRELPDIQAGFKRAEESEIKLQTFAGSLKKQESSRKTSTSALLTTPKPVTVWITTNCGKFLKRWAYQATWPASWEICMQVRKQQLELDMEQQTVSKWGKEYIEAVYCHPAYLTSMQSTSWETLGWMKHKLESRLPGEISITSDMQMTPPLRQKVKN